MTDYVVVHDYGKLPMSDRRYDSRQKSDGEPVIRIDPEHETDAHGWPTDEAIRKATEKVNK